MTILPDLAFAVGPPLVAARPATSVDIGGLGDSGTLMLSGPTRTSGAEELAVHVTRWGHLPDFDGAEVRTLLRDSHLDGRGGGGFPLIRKVETARLSPGRPVLIINASESEPASKKDRTLCHHRPHLVLDGASLLARSLGVDDIVIHAHRGDASPSGSLSTAIAYRVAARLADPAWRLSEGPDRYVSGESSAVASFVEGGEARPHFTIQPLAVQGPSGRPTVVSNAETVAQLAIIARIGPVAWNGLGAPSSPGPHLVTLAGAVTHPGVVLELTGPGTIGDLLTADGVVSPPAAVLVGGFAGTWILGEEGWQTPFNRGALACVEASPGCGLIGVLPHDACGLNETARIVRYLAGESAGQCGTCVAGLPSLADSMEALAGGSFRRRGVRKMTALADTILGSGACGHPDAVVKLIRSTLDVFHDDVVRHLTGSPCRNSDHPPVLHVPDAVIGPLADGSSWL